MYHPEVHETVKRVQLLEKLDFDLTITDEAYRSDHTPSGEVRVFTKAEKNTVRDREYPPQNLLSKVTELLREEGGIDSSFPGTNFYVGFARTPPLERDEEAVREDYVTEAVEVEGVPENGTVEFDADWDLEEAERSLAESETHYETREYDIEGFPTDQLPIIVRAELESNAVQWGEKLGLPNPYLDRIEGLAVLDIELEYRDTLPGTRRLRTDRFQVDMSRTFPQIHFHPQDTATYDPENRRVEWAGRRVRSGESLSYGIIGPIGELLDVESVSATLTANIDGRTLSGLRVKGVFDESGEKFPSTAAVEAERKVTITADIDIDPSALQGDARKTSKAKLTIESPPDDVWSDLQSVFRRNGIHIRKQDEPGDVQPAPGRDGVFTYEESGEFEVHREYAERGIVHATLVVDGEYTAVSQESQVSAFDESEDRLVRADEGAMETRGRTTVEMSARSASSQLNSEFVSTIETELAEGGEY